MTNGLSLVVYSYFPFFIGLMIVAVVNFLDDMKSLSDSVRLWRNMLQ